MIQKIVKSIKSSKEVAEKLMPKLLIKIYLSTNFSFGKKT
jgi:hypothetical protein